MALKDPRHKLQSSLAMFEFANKELIFLDNTYDWENLSQDYPDATGQSRAQYHQLIISIRIAAFGYHLEVMQQALKEYCLNEARLKLDQHHEDALNELSDFLFYLRCTLAHAKGELVPRWKIDKINKKKEAVLKNLQEEGLTVKIPAIEESAGVRFDEKSKKFKTLNFKIRLNKPVSLSKHFIGKIRLLSWHVLTILKKQNLSTLSKYLDHTTKKKRKSDCLTSLPL